MLVKQKGATRSSLRLKSINKKPKSIVKLAHDVLAKKWGILNVEEEMEDLTLQQHIDIYKKPLSQPAMAAVRKLTEIAMMKKKRMKSATRKKETKNKHSAETVAQAV
jgi:hypothetical protein